MHDFEFKKIKELQPGEEFRLLVCHEKMNTRTKYYQIGSMSDKIPQSRHIKISTSCIKDSAGNMVSLDAFKERMNTLYKQYSTKFVDQAFYDLVAVHRPLSKKDYVKDSLKNFVKGLGVGLTWWIFLLLIGYLIGHIFGYHEPSSIWKEYFIDLEPLSKFTATIGCIIGVCAFIYIFRPLFSL